MNVQIRKKSMENQLMYQIVKVYIRCIDSPDMENAWVRKRQNPSTCKQFIQKKRKKKKKKKLSMAFWALASLFKIFEQWIIYAKKTVNNFLNNAEQKIILCKMLKIVYAEKSEQFLWENSEQF